MFFLSYLKRREIEYDTICSMTWNGLQGFQTPIENDSFIVDGVGALGRTHTERGLTYYEVALSGHMCVTPTCFL